MNGNANFTHIHPKQYDPQAQPSDPHHKRQNGLLFGAWGTCDTSLNRQRLYGRLLRSGRVVAVGNPVHASPPLWIIAFQKIDPHDDYTLEIWDKDPAAGGNQLHSEPGVAVAGTYGPTITFPTGGVTINNTSFAAWGNTDEVSNVSGTFSIGGGNSYNGTPMIQPSQNMLGWMMQFSVDPGQHYVLHVVNALGHAAPDQTNITVT